MLAKCLAEQTPGFIDRMLKAGQANRIYAMNPKNQSSGHFAAEVNWENAFKAQAIRAIPRTTVSLGWDRTT